MLVVKEVGMIKTVLHLAESFVLLIYNAQVRDDTTDYTGYHLQSIELKKEESTGRILHHLEQNEDKQSDLEQETVNSVFHYHLSFDMEDLSADCFGLGMLLGTSFFFLKCQLFTAMIFTIQYPHMVVISFTRIKSLHFKIVIAFFLHFFNFLF